MRTNLIFLFFLLATVKGFTQDYNLVFSYDNSGNQTLRERVCVNCSKSTKPSKQPVAELTEESEEVEDALASDTKITAYPNPVTHILKVEWTATDTKVEQILIFTMNNSQVYNSKIKHDSYGSVDIDFSNYPSGSYILIAVYSDQSNQSFKIIKK